MPRSRDKRAHKLSHACAAIVLCAACLLVPGCTAPVHKQAVALASATAPVIDKASAAYREVQSVHSQRLDFDAGAALDQTGVFDPSTVQTWPQEKDIDVRLKVLAAFDLYVKNVVAITNGTDSPALDQASESLGSDLTSLGNTLAPPVESALGIAPAAAATTTSTTPAPLISAGTQKGIAEAIDAFGQFLVYRTIQKDLPPKLVQMDPHVKTLCQLLANDTAILQEQEKLDSNHLIDGWTDLIRNSKVDPLQRRTAFIQVPLLARRQQADSLLFTDLHAALVRLELAHHALAAVAQGNSPESLKQKISDLQSAGASLGKLH